MQSKWQIKFMLAIATRSIDLESNQSTVRVRNIKTRKDIHDLDLAYKFLLLQAIAYRWLA